MMQTVLQDLLRQGSGSSRSIHLVADAGYLSVRSEGDRFVLCYTNDSYYNFKVSGFDKSKSDYSSNKFIFSLGKADLDSGYGFPAQPGVTEFNFTLTPSTFLDYKKVTPTADVNGQYLNFTVTFENVLSGLKQIEITNLSSQTHHFVGRILIFDLNYLQYELNSISGTYRILFENGGVLSQWQQSSNEYLEYKPKILNATDDFVMRMIQFVDNSKTTIGGFGSFTSTVSFALNESRLLENKIMIPYSSSPDLHFLKLQVFGENENAWRNYFTSEQYFGAIPGDLDDTLYLGNTQQKSFTLSYSKVLVDLGVMIG